MTSINKVLIIGLGGVGCVVAAGIYDYKTAGLKVLLDKERYEKYIKTPTSYNSKIYNFDYVLPDKKDYKADLIIIATKNDGLKEAVSNIKNFVHEDTIFLSLLNGIHSEKVIAKVYGERNVLYSFYIGSSCIRDGRNITRKGDYNIVTGAKYGYQKEILKKTADFLSASGINIKVSDKIEEEYWQKFMINVGINQLSAVTNKTLNEIKNDDILVERLKRLMYEAALVAEKEGIVNAKKICKEAVDFLIYKQGDATPSMLQDVRAGRKTEVDIFAGTVINLGRKYGIETPENNLIYEKLK